MSGISEKKAGEAKQTAELTRLYRQIGISAVAAAARYNEGPMKQPAYSTAQHDWDGYPVEAA